MPTDPPAPFHPAATRRDRSNNNSNESSSNSNNNTNNIKNANSTVVRVGVGVIVVNAQTQHIYAGIRGRHASHHGAGTLALPGGHLELYESWQECARREVWEEMNIPPLSLQQIEFCHVTNDPMPAEQKHYVTIFMMGRITPQQAAGIQNKEPDKCEGWKAFSWQQLQEKAAAAAATDDDDEGGDDGDRDLLLFGPLQRLVEENPPALHAYLSNMKNSAAMEEK